MKKTLRRNVFLSIGALWFGLAGPLSAQTVLYDNSVNDLHIRFNPSTYQVGNEINLASVGEPDVFLVRVVWDQHGEPLILFAGAIQADVTILSEQWHALQRLQYPRPTDLVRAVGFRFATWGPCPTARSTFIFTEEQDFPSGGLPITNPDMTWTVQFEGLGTDRRGGGGPLLASSCGNRVGDFGDYWQNDGTGWTLLTNSVRRWISERNGATPEPSSMALSLLGGLGILIAMRRFRRKE